MLLCTASCYRLNGIIPTALRIFPSNKTKLLLLKVIKQRKENCPFQKALTAFIHFLGTWNTDLHLLRTLESAAKVNTGSVHTKSQATPSSPLPGGHGNTLSLTTSVGSYSLLISGSHSLFCYWKIFKDQSQVQGIQVKLKVAINIIFLYANWFPSN